MQENNQKMVQETAEGENGSADDMQRRYMDNPRFRIYDTIIKVGLSVLIIATIMAFAWKAKQSPRPIGDYYTAEEAVGEERQSDEMVLELDY